MARLDFRARHLPRAIIDPAFDEDAMRLPFTEAEFLDVFGAYNRAAWPMVVSMWLATLLLVGALFLGRSRSIAPSTLAAVHWLWSGAVYHALFFSAINPAAWLFSAALVVEGLLFAWLGVVRRQLTFVLDRSASSAAGIVLLAYSLAYPLLVVASGHEPPRAPLFAVPCPTTIFTAGLLMVMRPSRIILTIVPILWAITGGTAAFALSVKPDLMLFGAAALLVLHAADVARSPRAAAVGVSPGAAGRESESDRRP
jgi:hypothetical protein